MAKLIKGYTKIVAQYNNYIRVLMANKTTTSKQKIIYHNLTH